MSIEKGVIGFEDINFGTDTFQRKSQSGQFIPITKIRASHIPVVDSAGRFTGTEVETALSECMTREESGSNVKKLTNRSGSSREAGDVVIIDTNNDNSFTTTTSEGSVLVLGVVLETIANLATGLVATGGYVGSVKVTGATVRGDYLKTSTTVLKAVPSTFKQGVFAIALSNDASVVSAYIFGLFGAASGTVVTNLNAEQHNGLKVKVIEIGDWNMYDSGGGSGSDNILVNHGLTLSNIRSIDVLVRDDSNAFYYPLDITSMASTIADGYTKIGSSSVTLTIRSGGLFDSTAFNTDTFYNRGWITIWYV